MTTIDTCAPTLPLPGELAEPARTKGYRLVSALKRTPSGDVLWLIGGQAILAAGQLAGVRFLTEAVRPEIVAITSKVCEPSLRFL